MIKMILIALVLCNLAFAGTDMASKQQLIDKVISTAGNGKQREFLRKAAPQAIEVQERYGIPASGVLAMAIYESYYGTSKLARMANNYFGLKAARWSGPTVGASSKDGWSRYRKYGSMKDGFNGYVTFIKQGRYSRAWKAKNGQAFVKELLRAGYCPDDDYLRYIRSIMSRHRLQLLDA